MPCQVTEILSENGNVLSGGSVSRTTCFPAELIQAPYCLGWPNARKLNKSVKLRGAGEKQYKVNRGQKLIDWRDFKLKALKIALDS